MKIQIRRTFIEASIQFEAGQVLDLPDELAQLFLDDERATELEGAAPSAVPSISGSVPAPRAQKGKRR